jgi:ABC-type phosphate transport system substrate-binding protein
MMGKTVGIAALLLALGGSLVAQEGAGYRVIVNAASKETSIRRSDLSDIFLKKTTHWPHGGTAVPVDQSTTSPARTSFSKDVHGQSVDTLLQYWQQQIFSGRDTPPRVKLTDAEVLAFVQSNAGAVGYVAETTTLGEGVKALTLTK